MLSSMSLTDYRGWIRHIKANGFSFRNQELLLQQMNASIFNATGRMTNPLSADDFSVRKATQAASPSTLSQPVLNELLSQQASRLD
uniref:Uncharacterized protein n=2 Tax=Vibrio splendidus TaxID=29497 RepID=A0A0H3ZRC6_VIBSP|nr:hypothetical protein [Vibrio splendidus]